MLEFKKPIPVVVMDGNNGWENGYAIYVSKGGTFENDIWTVVLCGNGIIRHYSTSQVRMHYNSTFGIKKNV